MSSQGNSRIIQRGSSDDRNGRISVVVVRTDWNPGIVDALDEGCHRILRQSGVVDIRTLRVPGAVEIPFAVRRYWEAVKYRDDRPDAFISLACVIKGDTPHFDHVCQIVSQGVLQLNLTLPVPTIFGVLTVLDEAQAWERLGGKHGHKGEEAALTALSMIRLVTEMTKRPQTGSKENLS
jgi:6,7-dimethyl-8-ribityllumazine synthase